MIRDTTKALSVDEWRAVVGLNLDWELTPKMQVRLRDKRRGRQATALTLKLAFDKLFYGHQLA